MSRLGLYVKFTARPGQRDALVALLLQAASLIEAAPGCELWLINTSPTEADAVWVTELWRSEAEHDTSLTLPGVREQIGQVMPLLAGPPERTDVVPVGGAGLRGA
jgi:quinol monooxygenase YgiN